MSAVKPEDFTVHAERDGSSVLSCPCGRWDQEFGVLTGVGDDLGSLVDAARGHLKAAHRTEGDAP